MKARKSVFAMVAAIGVAMGSVLFASINAEGQTAMQGSAPRFARARIPFDFWIGGSHLPAGDYTLNFSLETLVLFRNPGANMQEQAFLIPRNGPGRGGEGKLVFFVQNGQRDLEELWNSNGRAVLASNAGVSPCRGNPPIEIALTEDLPDKTAAER